MKIIKMLSEQIIEEIEGAERYIKDAIKFKEEYPSLAKTLYDISIEEMRHVDLLHGEVVKIIDAYRKEHGEPPETMKAVYEYMHEKHIEEACEVRMYQELFRK